MTYRLIEGDALDVLMTLSDDGVDVVLTDPPYGIDFMGKRWDHKVPGPVYWAECLRVAKPGAPLLAFGGTRTYHRLMCAIEDGGWEIRDCLMWVYSSGMPKSHDVEKALKKTNKPELAKIFNGYGTGLKPAWEPIILAMKPLDGTYANNAATWGVAGLNIDESRVPITDGAKLARMNGGTDVLSWGGTYGAGGNRAALEGEPAGRWPANVVHDGSDEVLESFPVTDGGTFKGPTARLRNGVKLNPQGNIGKSNAPDNYGDSGSAARYFYCAKASTRERTAGGMFENNHPTVKPLALLRYLVKLTNPPGGGLFLDPFCGSGTGGMAALLEGAEWVGIDRDPDYVALARRRIEARGKL